MFFLLYTPIGYIKTLRRENVKETISKLNKLADIADLFFKIQNWDFSFVRFFFGSCRCYPGFNEI